MAGADVRNLVRHHAGQFRFVVGGKYQARVHKEEAAGKRKRIDLIGVDDLDNERDLGIGVTNKVLSDAVHILGNHRVLHHLSRAVYLLGETSSQRNLLFDGVPVAHAPAAAYVAVSDGAEVVDAAVVILRFG